MKVSVDFWSEQKYLPTKRHRVLRTRHVKNRVDVDVKELTLEEFPIAFVVHDYQSVYENAKSYDDFKGNGDFRLFSEEIRTYNGKFYTPVRITHGVAISLIFEPLSYIQKSLRQYEPLSEPVADFTAESIVMEDSIEDKKQQFFCKRLNMLSTMGKYGRFAENQCI